MSLLPTTSRSPAFTDDNALSSAPSLSLANGHANGRPAGLRMAAGGWARTKMMAKRVIRFSQMDFELAAWQLTYLCVAPRYRQVYYHKQTKNTWARDDPAMLLLISGCLALSGLLWSVFYARYPPFMVLRTMLSMIFVDFILVGILVSTALWAGANRFLTHSSHTHATDQKVEWAYAFDVHANSFFPLFLHLYVAQLILSPVVTRQNWVCLWVGNTIYLAALSHYTYVTYLGYNALPFLIRSELLLFPIAVLSILYIVSLLGVNVARGVLSAYFFGGKVSL